MASAPLWLCLSLPCLPCDVWPQGDAGGMAVVEQQRVVACNQAARQAGVRTGMRLSEAYALFPDLQAQARRLEAERALLDALAQAAYAFSAAVVIWGEDSVIAEVGRSLKLLPLARIQQSLRRTARELGVRARLGIAPTPAMARLAADKGWQILNAQSLNEHYRQLSLDSLHLPDKARDTLTACGLRTLGELQVIPRSGLIQRFGDEVVAYLDSLLCHTKPLDYYQPPAIFDRRIELVSPSTEAQALRFPLRRLLGMLSQFLIGTGQSLQRWSLELETEQAAADLTLSFGLRQPQHDPEHLLELSEEKIADQALRAPVVAIRLVARELIKSEIPQRDLFAKADQTALSWSQWLDKLQSRLGDGVLFGIDSQADHRPERAWRKVEPGNQPMGLAQARRPLWLLDQPEHIDVHALVLEEGPERIETGWWDGHDCRRDYFTARDTEGRSLWVFRQYKPDPGWFLHGLFG